MDLGKLAYELTEDFETLVFEVVSLDRVFKDTTFFGHPSNMPNAHYGYLMVCLSKIDLLSNLLDGAATSQGQTPRMKAFLERYMYPHKAEEQSVALQLLRHTLMHTGKLRFVFSSLFDARYTWRVHWSDLPPQFAHFTISTEDELYQDQLAAITVPRLTNAASFRAFNISVVQLAKDLRSALAAYLQDLASNPLLQSNAQVAMQKIQIQMVSK